MQSVKKYLSIIICFSMLMSMLIIPVDSNAAAKIKLSKTKITMTVGASTVLTVKLGKKKVSGSKVKWKTSNKKVVSVSKGKLKAKKAGNAKITATYKGTKKVCKVTVKAKSSDKNINNADNNNNNTNTTNSTNTDKESVYAISQSSASIEVDNTLDIKVTKDGSDATYSASWSSSSLSVASVSNGVVTAKGPGSATITATIGGKSFTCAITVTVPNYTISNESAKLDTGDSSKNSIHLSLKNGITSVSKVQWKSDNEDVATVDENGLVTAMGDGTATITGTKYGKECKCVVNVDGFVFGRDVDIVTDYKDVYVNFDVKKTNGQIDPEEKAALEGLGFEISSDGKASKNQKCETATYTFKRLPKTLSEIESFFDDPEEGDTIDISEEGNTGNYGGFNAMAATICATNVDVWVPNPADPYYSKHPVREMFEYINGPSLTIAETAKTQGIQSMKDAIQACGENVYKSYFKGATPDNNYTPDTPYVLEMYKGPYYIPEKETITGYRPTTYMILVSSEAFDSDRYIDVYYSPTAKRWFSYENQFQHITANNFKKPKPQL